MGLMHCRDTKKFTHTAGDKLDGEKSMITLQVIGQETGRIMVPWRNLDIYNRSS